MIIIIIYNVIEEQNEFYVSFIVILNFTHNQFVTQENYSYFQKKKI